VERIVARNCVGQISGQAPAVKVAERLRGFDRLWRFAGPRHTPTDTPTGTRQALDRHATGTDRKRSPLTGADRVPTAH
jgi:hypothetical protein